MTITEKDVYSETAIGTGKKRKKPKPKTHITIDHPQHGRIEVRSMRGVVHGDAVTLSASAAAGTQDAPVWIQIAKPGRFLGHPSGPFELNERVFSEIIANFKAHPEHIPIDHEHASEAPANEGSIPTHGAPAQGWITDMKIEGGNLWGLVEWTAQAREYIKNGNYRHFSPAVRLGSKDRVTGKPIGARMTSGALTNSPYLAGMQRIAARDEPDDDDDDFDDDNEEIPALAEDNNPTKGDMQMDAKTLKDAEDKIVVLNDRFTMAQNQVSELTLKLSAAESERTKLATENKILTDKVEAIEMKAIESEVDEAIMVYADSKGAKPEMRPHLLSWAKSDPSGFRAMYPRVQRGHEHLQRNLSNDGPSNGRGAMGGTVLSLSDRTKEIMIERKLPFAAAQSEASKEFRPTFVNNKGAR
jgi:phage I-like protein